MTEEQKNIPSQEAVESLEENKIIKTKLEQALSDSETRQKAIDDFSISFSYVGLEKEQADILSRKVIEIMAEQIPMEESEKKVRELFERYPLNGKSFIDNITEKFTGRAELIYEQVSPYLKDIEGKTLDYGSGNCQVTQLLHDNGLDIEGVDVRDFRVPGITVPFKVFNGHHVDVSDGHYEAGVMTNVAHHEKDNEKIITELTRVIKHKLVIIETVPTGSTSEEVEKDRDRTFLNDVLWNRYFWNANIPVPGTYETPEGWIERFKKHGWKVVESVDLGIDQPIVRDTHHLLVLER